jgi:RNA polymerase sigma factor (sigma-70 family)
VRPRSLAPEDTVSVRAVIGHAGSTDVVFGVNAEGDAAMSWIATQSCLVGELDLETVQSVRAHFTALGGGGVPDARWIEAWDRFYAAYDPLVRRLARRRCSNTSDVDDCVQQVWLAVAAHFRQYDPRRGPLQNWLTVLICHVLAEYQRSQHPLRHLDDESEQRLVGREADPAIVRDWAEEQDGIQCTLRQLGAMISKTNYRILYDHWIEGKTFAANQHLTPKQVRDRHRRAMARLRLLLGRRL